MTYFRREPPLLFKGGDRGVVADAHASVTPAKHHPLTAVPPPRLRLPLKKRGKRKRHLAAKSVALPEKASSWGWPKCHLARRKLSPWPQCTLRTLCAKTVLKYWFHTEISQGDTLRYFSQYSVNRVNFSSFGPQVPVGGRSARPSEAKLSQDDTGSGRTGFTEAAGFARPNGRPQRAELCSQRARIAK